MREPLRIWACAFIELAQEAWIFPDRASRASVVGMTREQVPVHMWRAVAQELVVELARSKRSEDGLGHNRHLVHVHVALRRRQLVQLAHAALGDEDRVALVVLHVG